MATGTTKLWVDTNVLRRNKISRRNDAPIIMETPDGKRRHFHSVTLTNGERMYYDAKCTACASVVLEIPGDGANLRTE